MAVFLLLAAALVAQAAIDPGLLNLVMPEAKVLSGIQVERSLISPFGKYVFTQMQFEDEGFRKFVAETGFDPRRDLREILAASSGDGRTLIIGRGVFNPARIVSAARAAGGIVTPYRGVDIVVHNEKDSTGALAFLDSTIALMGDEASLRATVDRRGAAPVLSPALVTKARQISATNHAWFATVSSPAEFLAGKMADPNLSGAMHGNLLEAVLEASGGIRFGAANVTISGEAVTRSEKDAQALVDVMKFLAGLVQLNRENDRRAAKIASLADTAKFIAEGNVMKLTMSVPEDLIEKLFMPDSRAKKAAAAVR